MMAKQTHFIAGKWIQGLGAPMTSFNPATGDKVWGGQAAGNEQVDQAVASARDAFESWSSKTLEDRLVHLERYRSHLEAHKDQLAKIISRENGKPLWDSLGEVTAMINKIAISVDAYNERTPTRVEANGEERTALRHRPHGVLAVFGPYNFPGHLPNGHIVPALLAGNTVVFKPSELTPQAAEAMVRAWNAAELPDGVLNLIQGGIETGQALSQHGDIDGLLFTGSATVGTLLHKQFGGQTEKILALELGGNNPLIVHDVEDAKAAALTTIQSAFITSGQRCTCARRLIVPDGNEGDAFLEELAAHMDRIQVGAYDDAQVPYMGPVISNSAAELVLKAQKTLMQSGAVALRQAQRLVEDRPFLSPGLVDVTLATDVSDNEVFGPFLQIKRVQDFDEAIRNANNTRFGLAAGLLSDNEAHWTHFRNRCRAGIVNWNKPLTGASSKAPFGGIGLSGNHRPSAYYAADYCAYPMASMEATKLIAPPMQGLTP